MIYSWCEWRDTAHKRTGVLMKVPNVPVNCAKVNDYQDRTVGEFIVPFILFM